MKKNFSLLFALFFCFVMFSSSSCNVGGAQSGNNSSIEEQITSHDIYLDDAKKISNGISVVFSCYESVVSYSSENRVLEMRVVCKNTSMEEKRISVSNAGVLHELTNITYTASIYPSGFINLQYGIDTTFTFRATIPTSYKTDKYIFVFSIGDNYKVHLYEKPDELRKDCMVKFVVSGSEVHSVKVKERRCLTETYIWEDDNHLYHCNEWYTDDNFKVKFVSDEEITSDITLYGREESNIQTTYESGKIFVTDIDYVPLDGIIVIQSHGLFNVYISNFALHNDSSVKEIYLPATLKKIYYGNFDGMPKLEKICFAGSKEEWDLIMSDSSSEIPSNVVIIYNSSFSN
ncbi:MAG: hypothetical protein J6D30_01750 [Clostridia bacterium]|nr:hypothetical protein [Clostridia bacterium]